MTGSAGFPSTDDQSFAEVFDQHYPSVCRFLRRRVNAELASDLTAETFLIALKDFDRFDPDRGTYRAWLFGIASNLMRHELRRERRELRAFARSGIDPVASDWTNDSDRRIDAVRQSQRLARGLASLRADDREALLLYCWANLSYPEIGQALGVPPGTVKSRISRARSRMRKALGGSNELTNIRKSEEATNG